MYAKSLQSCLALCDPVDCNLPGSSDHGIFQARILEWVAMPSSRGSSQPRDQTCVSPSPAFAGKFFTTSTSWEAHTVCELLVIHLYELCCHFALFYILLLLFIYPQEWKLREVRHQSSLFTAVAPVLVQHLTTKSSRPQWRVWARLPGLEFQNQYSLAE